MRVGLAAYISSLLTFPSLAKCSLSEPPRFSGVSKEETLRSFLDDMGRVTACSTPLVTPTHSQRDSSYTRNWSHDDWEAQLVSPLIRYWQHVKGWARSPTAVAVAPMVLMVSVWSLAVLLMDRKFAPWHEFLKTTSIASTIGGLSAPLALLLTLRTNRALDRLLEARRCLGIITRSSTSLSSLVATNILPQNPKVAIFLARYVCLLGWATKGYFMREDDKLILATVLPKEEARWLAQSPGDTPTLIVLRIRSVISQLNLDLASAISIENRLNDIELSLGVCKRILGSPIPPTFSRHMSRVLFLYLVLLPMGLVGAGLAPRAVVLSAALTAYVLVGIDEIGVEIEHPFRLLPLCSLATVLQRNVMNIAASHGNMPTNTIPYT